MSKFQDEKNKWVSNYDRNVPPGTLVGGYDLNGESIYLARASHNGDVIPGKFLATQHCTYISCGGLEIAKKSYEVFLPDGCPAGTYVLVRGSNNWIAASGKLILPEAFPGGQTSTGETLYVGRVRYQGSLTTGKVQKSEGGCYITFDGKEYHFTEYEVLLP